MTKRIAAALIFFLWPAESVAAPEFVRVAEKSGSVERFDPALSSWAALEAPCVLKSGEKIRTGPESAAEIVFDSRYDSVMRLGERSRLTILNREMNRVSLDEGTLYARRERGEGPEIAPWSLRVLTRRFLLVLDEGGFTVRVEGESMELKVFGDSLKIYAKADPEAPMMLEEGWKFNGTEKRRLGFEDYEDWRVWFRKNDERRDRLAQPIFSG